MNVCVQEKIGLCHNYECLMNDLSCVTYSVSICLSTFFHSLYACTSKTAFCNKLNTEKSDFILLLFIFCLHFFPPFSWLSSFLGTIQDMWLLNVNLLCPLTYLILVFSLMHTFLLIFIGYPRWLSGKESTCQCGRCWFNPWLRKIPWRRKWQRPPIFLPGKSHGQRSLAGCSPWGHKRVRHNLVTKQQQQQQQLCLDGKIWESSFMLISCPFIITRS